jgi:hypothetical protein
MNCLTCGVELYEYRRKRCKPCSAARAKQLAKQRFAKGLSIIREHKSQPCSDCGKEFPHFVMDLDHMDPNTKIYSPRRNTRCYAGYKESRLRVILSTCEVVCANCHRIRTKANNHYVIKKRPVVKPNTNHASLKRKMAKRVTKVEDYLLLLKSNPCTDCGQTVPPEVMDFDHRDGKKKMAISEFKRMKRTLSVVKKELEKCDLVCANCHRIRTWKRQH